MALNEFGPFVKINGCFVVRNISDPKKTISIFNTPTGWGKSRDLLSLRGVAESDIRSSLLKGELRNRLLNKEIIVECSDVDLLQFNDAQKQFLTDGGITKGLQVGADELGITHYEDVGLIGAVDDINRVYTIPSGVFFWDGVLHKFLLYKNGVKQAFLDDFVIFEGGGPGTGYTGVIFSTDSVPNVVDGLPDVITADYYVET